ncbi:MAG TPA: response regulator transcription factor [Candidatus Limnocylindrales bacterium]|nr:response regulator transcription factor [Candidatus Limnocylindrales bacterium]
MGIRILVVDDHPAVTDSLVRLVEEEADLEEPAIARNLAEATEVIERLGADLDLVVCDVQMGGEAEGLRLLERFGSRPRPRFLMLSAFDYPTLVRAAFERGARGYLLKTAELAEIVAAIRSVAAGATAFSASTLTSISLARRRPSVREIELLVLLAAGASNDQIASELVLSLKTVESHLRRLFNRYGVMNRTELAVLALREGWIDAAAPPATRGDAEGPVPSRS